MKTARAKQQKNKINNNIHLVFLVNGREKYVNSVNDFYLVEEDS